MTTRVFRSKKSEWLLWTFYFLAFFTVISFAIVFARFTLRALHEVLSYGPVDEMLHSFLQTLKLLGITYLWVVPWTALLALFYFMDEQDWKRILGRQFIKFFLRIPPLAIGATILFVMKDFSQTLSMSLVIGLIALPRLVFGWIGLVKKTSSDLHDTGLALGMSKWQLLKYVYLKREAFAFARHILRVTCLLLGAVAPFIYLAHQPHDYLSLRAFQGVVSNPQGSATVWSSLFLLFTLTFVLTPQSREVF